MTIKKGYKRCSKGDNCHSRSGPILKKVFFSRNRSSCDGLDNQCKDCKKEYRKINRDKRNKKHKVYLKSNALFSIGGGLVEYIENRNGLLFVECKNCKDKFNPSNGMVIARKQALNSVEYGHHYLYCSNKCKSTCPEFKRTEEQYLKDHRVSIGKDKYMKNREYFTGESVAIEFAKKRDGMVCTECGSGNNLQGHHIIPHKKLIGTKDEYLITDTGNIVTVCKKCHYSIYHSHGNNYINNLKNVDNNSSICRRA